MDERVVVVTGAGNGIGFQITKTLLADGYRVAGLDLALENMDLLESVHPGRLLCLRCDVVDDAQVSEAVAATVARWGRIDVLVNNAAIARFGPFAAREMEDFRREIEIDFFAYLRLIKAVLPHMLARGEGIIHNVSSAVGLTGFAEISGYAASKGALEAFARTLRLELAPHGIHVTLMHPPLTNTSSSAPLGVPALTKANPRTIGRAFARRILSTRAVITPDLQTALYVAASRLLPGLVGRTLSTLAARTRRRGGRAG